MAPIPATATINWTSNYNGPHRVCYRIVGAPSYTCTDAMSHPSCPGSGAPCSYIIALTVDNETCDTINYEGYVQPACEEEASLDKRVAFAFSFIPAPACKRWEVTCDNAPVATMAITNGGSGYNPLSAPIVTVAGGGGAGATATVTVGDGAITGTVLTDAGTGYTDGVYPATPLIGGSGAGATADITIAGGIITVFTMVNAGAGYLTGETLAPDTGVVGVPATPAIITLTTNYGIIISIAIGATGSGYTTPPSVTVPPPGAGVQATFSATLDDCPAIDTDSCAGGTEYTYPEMAIGEEINICGTTAPSLGSQFAVAEDGNCLCTCQTINFQNTGPSGTVTIQYITCAGASVEVVLNNGAETGDVCIVTGSSAYTEAGGGVYNAVVGAACTGVIS